MNINDAKIKEAELIQLLKDRYPDIVAHIDPINGTDEIAISFFWNRISAQRWNNAQSFKGKSVDYQKILTNEIIPYFNKDYNVAQQWLGLHCCICPCRNYAGEGNFEYISGSGTSIAATRA